MSTKGLLKYLLSSNCFGLRRDVGVALKICWYCGCKTCVSFLVDVFDLLQREKGRKGEV